jgi:TPR repeat protein
MQAQNLLIKGKAKKAFKLFKKCANYDYQDCIFMLGFLYDTGEGVKVDKQKAKSLYKVGAKNNNESAMTNLAILYREEYKYKKMLKWFKKALHHNDGDASLEIAQYYLQKAKIKKAIKYLKLAINHKNITEYSQETASDYLKQIQKFKKSK